MKIDKLEQFIQDNKIKTIPSEFWRLKNPDSVVLLEPFNDDLYNKVYRSNIIDKTRTFNITFLFQREDFYHISDIVSLVRFLFKSNYTKQYKIIFKFNYTPPSDLIRTFSIAGITYVNHLEQDQYYGLLQNSHVIVSIHRTNYSGRYLAEAAMFGIPIITSQTGGSMQLFNQNNCIFLKTKNADGIENFAPCHECYAGVFSAIENNYTTLVRFGIKARANANRLYSVQKYKETLKSIVENYEQ